ncbi:hypothetical protein AA80_05925 [Petrotoga sibirica DSM 13575]|uniref:DUF4351 domain-containing protein n=3 Tax=Petrotogaceae TaxID=1643949 RepID=A0A4R8EXP0_9BACT|nr:hypothetical protein AA80_05925 [Petrotoga sibirica DSM 13575]POZ90608.1 hypothetical protein AD60_06335 [Petrotoga sp. SL27]TDX14967.1 hypothetical protein C8D74_1082 [Petrotoga sibirica]
MGLRGKGAIKLIIQQLSDKIAHLRKKRIIGLTATKVALEAMRAGTAMTEKEFKERLAIVFAYINQLPEEQVHEWFEGCMIYLLNVREDITIEDILKVQKEIMPGRGEIVMTIAEKLRNEGMEKGKLEGEREFAIKILSKRFGNQLTEEIKDKIRKADEKTIDYIGDNLLEITIEDLKELLK